MNPSHTMIVDYVPFKEWFDSVRKVLDKVSAGSATMGDMKKLLDIPVRIENSLEESTVRNLKENILSDMRSTIEDSDTDRLKGADEFAAL